MTLLTKLGGPLRMLQRILPLLWSSARRWTVLSTAMMVAEIASGLGVLYLIKRLIDSVHLVLGDGVQAADGIDALLVQVALTGLCTLAYLASRSLAALARENQGMMVAEHIDRLIHARAIEADLAFYESPRYFDTLQRAREAGSQRPAQVVANLLMLGRNLLLLAGVLVLMVSIHWLLLPVLLIAVIPALLVRVHFARRLHDWRRRRTQMERQAGYLDWLLTADYHAKEIRLNRLGPHLSDLYSGLRRRIRTEHLGINTRRTMFDLGVATLGTVAFFGSLAFLALQTASGRTSVGDLVLFLLVFQRAQATGQEVVQQISTLYEDQLYIALLFEFLDIRPTLTDPPEPLSVPVPIRDGLRLEGVGFRYPGTDHDVLKDIDMYIPPGRISAIVGANGSGKTTLIKLLCRLYDPSEGRITLDGVDIRRFRLEDYRRVFSVIFQDYSHYAESVRENIRYGDVRMPVDTPRVEAAAVQSGADAFLRTMKAGYDTRLSRMFDDGQEISLGQWQKIALARAFLPDSQLIILDEPTSALDPAAEYELFKDFPSTIDHRTALVISHRLSTIRQSDRIHVLEHGRVSEAGTHDELVRANGAYCALFARQAEFYRD